MDELLFNNSTHYIDLFVYNFSLYMYTNVFFGVLPTNNCKTQRNITSAIKVYFKICKKKNVCFISFKKIVLLYFLESENVNKITLQF